MRVLEGFGQHVWWRGRRTGYQTIIRGRERWEAGRRLRGGWFGMTCVRFLGFVRGARAWEVFRVEGGNLTTRSAARHACWVSGSGDPEFLARHHEAGTANELSHRN